MDAAAVRARLERMVASSSPPVLTESELGDLVEVATRPDSDGRLPTESGWVPTHDLRAAAAEGWRWKAAKVAGGYDFGTDGQQFSRSQVHAHCLAMAAQYAKGRFVSVPMGADNNVLTDVIGNVDCE